MAGGKSETQSIVSGRGGGGLEPREAGDLQESGRAETDPTRGDASPFTLQTSGMINSYCYELLCSSSLITAVTRGSHLKCMSS